MKRPRLRITLIDRKGSCPCHHGHKIGDSWDFDTERGQLCPMAMHVAFLYADILRYGGSIPGQPDGTVTDDVCYSITREEFAQHIGKAAEKAAADTGTSA